MSGVIKDLATRAANYARMPATNSKRFLIIAGGMFSAQLVSFFVYPLLSRIFSPAEFGEFSILVSASVFLSIFMTLRYELAMTAPRTFNQAGALLVGIGVIIALLLSSLMALLLTTYEMNFYQAHVYLVLTLAISTSALIGAHNTLNNFALRIDRIGTVAISKSAQVLALFVGALLLSHVANGLLFAYLLSWLIAVIICLIGIRELRNISGSQFTLIRIAPTLKRYRNFAVLGVVPAAFDAAAFSLPLYAFYIYYSPADAGHLSMMRTISYAPLAIIGAAVSQVLLRQCSLDIRIGHSPLHLYFRSTLTLFLIGTLYLVCIYGFFSALVHLLFPLEWQVVIDYAYILAPAQAIRFIASTVSIFLVGLQRLRAVAAWQVSYFIAYTIGLLFFTTENPTSVIWVSCLIDVLWYILYLFVTWIVVKSYKT
jgi:O-antigen/teichoic acid export membrane protein